MVNFIRKNFEWFLVIQVVLALGLLYLHHPIAPVFRLLAFLLIASFYLLSGFRVLMDKRFGRMIRILYFFGLWAMALGWIGIMYKVSFWQG